MLLSAKEQLVEMVRLLEEKHHVFKNDPVPITQSLKASNLPFVEKLISRASRIDAGQQILHSIQKVDARLKFVFWVVGIVWVVLGFLGLVALMQSQTVNFFYVLVSLLGLHTLMLLLWLGLQVSHSIRKTQPSSVLFSPSFLLGFLSKRSDPVMQSAIGLYTQQLQHKGMRWYLGKISHQLWLATLTGMFFAILFLLVVRQYNFSWQSTLLESETLVSIVSILAWLPTKLGFSAPSALEVVQSQALSQTHASMSPALAKKWAWLLIGSVLCYGFLPRLVAWGVCAFMFARQKLSLPVHLPYYQNLQSGWATQVVDADDMKPEIITKAPKAKLESAEDVLKVACLLESPEAINTAWAHNVLGAEWQTYAQKEGLVDDRDDMDALLGFLQTQKVQLLVGIRGNALPDRGMMRKIDKLAKHAQGGVVIKLLSQTEISQNLEANQQQTIQQQAKQQTSQLQKNQQRENQWHEALAQRGIALVV